ncbi:FliH/SctL family protein [Anaerosalibacter bizertensis]|uniref:FliH/SctL family protein n=1 Tax=Anaerosalibacter bizertensis TaxID=932217 RepID=UPI0035142887
MSRIIKSSKVVEERGDSLIKKTNNREEEILLKNAKKKYDEIVFAARSEAEKIIKSGHKEREAILNIAYREAENISNKWKDKGYQEGIKSGHTEGYDDGYEEGRRDSNILIDEALEIKEEYIKKKENLYREVEEDIIHLVLDISEKVIYDKINEDKEYITSLVLKGIESLNTTENLIVRISKEDYDIVEMSKNKILAKASLVNDLEIKVDSNLSKGDCIIETNKGSVDVSIDYQVNEIKELLNNILHSE